MVCNRVYVDKEFLEMLVKGRYRFIKRGFKLCRWILRDKVGEFIGSEGKSEGKG